MRLLSTVSSYLLLGLIEPEFLLVLLVLQILFIINYSDNDINKILIIMVHNKKNLTLQYWMSSVLIMNIIILNTNMIKEIFILEIFA